MYDDFDAICEAIYFQYPFIQPILRETKIDDVMDQLNEQSRFWIAQTIRDSTGVVMEECIKEVETFGELADLHKAGGDKDDCA